MGISDQVPDTFGDARLNALPIDDARMVVPWDVALTQPELLDAWLSAAASYRPLVSFQHARGDRCPEAPCRAPSASEVRDAFVAFRARWPQILEFTAWNEPNHPVEPVYGDPARAAAYHDVMRRACPACTIVAGDFVDNAAMKSYFTDYRAALAEPPMAWGIHNYGDLIYDRPSYVQWLLARVEAPVWLTETGGIVHLRNSAGQTVLPIDEQRAATAIDRLFALIAAEPDRIQRAYLYHWRAPAGAAFDAGLLRPDGGSRPALERVRAHLGARAVPRTNGPSSPPVAGSGDAAGQIPNNATPVQTPTSPPIAPRPGIGRPRRTQRGWQVPLRCPKARTRCDGRVSLAAGGRVVGSRRFTLRTPNWVRVHVRRRERTTVREPRVIVLLGTTVTTREARR